MPQDQDLDMPDRPERPTKTKTADPFSHLHDLDSFDLTGHLPAASGEETGPETPAQLPKMTDAETRRRVGQITPSGQMRDLINRINQAQDDEISDVEARRRAGLDQDTTDVPALNTPQVTADNLPAVLGSDVLASGMQNPEWSTINNLPGYLQRPIRAMGRGLFGLMTRTALEDIQTLANVQGQGPNTKEEIRAVAAWLRDNAQDLGPVEVGHGQAHPGYEPEAHDYSAQGIRFHVVRDPMGQYIYAWPEQDSRQSSNQPRLGHNRPKLPNRE